MRALWILIALSGSVFAQSQDIYGPPPPPPEPSVPKAYCPEPNYDWGTVYSGESVVHAFVVYNKGKAPLLIKRVRSSCGCTTTSYDREIEPGGKGKITLKVNTRGMRSRVRKTARVETNDPENPSFVLSIGGEVKPIVRVEPSYPLIEVLRGETGSTTVTVTSQIPKPIQIVSLEPRGTTKATYELKEVKKGKEYRVILKVDTTSIKSTYFYGQPISFNMKVRVEDKLYDVLVRAKLKIVNTVNPSKQYLYFSRKVVEKFLKEGGTPPSQKVELTGWEGREFAIKKIEIRKRKAGSFTETYVVENPPLAVKADTLDKASKHILTISLRQVPEEERRTGTFQIHVYTDDPNTSEVVLRATVYFPRRIQTSIYSPRTSGTTSRFPIRPSTTHKSGE